MGLLSKLKKHPQPPKKAGDDVLLLHAMLLMCSADGKFDDKEMPAVEAYFTSLPELAGKDFRGLYHQALEVTHRYASQRESVQALGELSSQTLKNKCYLLAADLAFVSGDVHEEEDRMLESMQKVLGVDDALAQKILDVLSLKYTR